MLDRARSAVPPLVDFAAPMPYVELQKMLDEANAWGLYAYDKGCYVEELSDGVIDVMVEHFPRKTSPLSILLFYRLDGAYSRVSEDATAFSGGRSPLRHLHHRHLPSTRDVPRRARVGPVHLGGAATVRSAGRLLPERASDFETPTRWRRRTAPTSSPGWSSSRRSTTRTTSSAAAPGSPPPRQQIQRRIGDSNP